VGKAGSEGQQERYEMTSRTAVLYARVSSREQREEGYSIEAQIKLLRAVARTRELKSCVSLWRSNLPRRRRKQFAEMVTFFKRNRSCRILLVEKTTDYTGINGTPSRSKNSTSVLFREGGEWLSKDSKSQVKFIQDIRLAMARNYSENLREEVKKGMSERRRRVRTRTPPLRIPQQQG